MKAQKQGPGISINTCSMDANSEVAHSSAYGELSHLGFPSWLFRLGPHWYKLMLWAVNCMCILGRGLGAWDKDKGQHLLSTYCARHCSSTLHVLTTLQRHHFLHLMADENEAQKGNWSKVTELEDGGAGIQTQTCTCNLVRSLPSESKIRFHLNSTG